MTQDDLARESLDFQPAGRTGEKMRVERTTVPDPGVSGQTPSVSSTRITAGLARTSASLPMRASAFDSAFSWVRWVRITTGTAPLLGFSCWATVAMLMPTEARIDVILA